MNNHNESIARTVHWAFAAYVIIMMILGFYMANSSYNLDIYRLHKSLGTVFFALVTIRLYTWIKHPWRSSSKGTKTERLVKAAHSALLILMIAMPVTGFLSSAFSGFSVHIFDFIIVPEHYSVSGEIVPFNSTVYEAAKLLHRLFAYALAALVTLHTLAALKHHFINKDDTLKRMMNT